ncbi:MAG: hypothetical protein DCC65_02215 [Planctomycetota bacterium]|nr:MAG: hypothetical protein DCC65_02215 [Planctomycetota bacterium]
MVIDGWRMPNIKYRIANADLITIQRGESFGKTGRATWRTGRTHMLPPLRRRKHSFHLHVKGSTWDAPGRRTEHAYPLHREPMSRVNNVLAFTTRYF